MFPTSTGNPAMASRKLQLTLADMGLLVAGMACGFWSVRMTGILYESSLPTLIHLLLVLDYFVWGLSFVGPAVVILHRTSVPFPRRSASEKCLFWLGTV